MMCTFGGISRAPLALMLMVAEMTGSLSMLALAMVAVGISWLIVAARRRHDLPEPAQEPGGGARPARAGRSPITLTVPDQAGDGSAAARPPGPAHRGGVP